MSEGCFLNMHFLKQAINVHFLVSNYESENFSSGYFPLPLDTFYCTTHQKKSFFLYARLTFQHLC